MLIQSILWGLRIVNFGELAATKNRDNTNNRWINIIFPYIGKNHPNWLFFFRGAGIPPTSMFSMYLYDGWRWSPTTRHPSLVGDTLNAAECTLFAITLAHHLRSSQWKQWANVGLLMLVLRSSSSPVDVRTFPLKWPRLARILNWVSLKTGYPATNHPFSSLVYNHVPQFHMDTLDIVGSYFVGKPW